MSGGRGWAMLTTLLQRAWRRRGAVALSLLPLAWAFKALAALRRGLYRCGALASERLPVPVVVIGNITVGGSGKTPLVLWLVEALRRRGIVAGIVSRGHGGKGSVEEVDASSVASQVGDEPLLLKRRCLAPVFVGRDRVAAGRALLRAYPHCQLILADDGLQHYRLQRDFEIAVLDRRGLMNRWPLPAGPLREPTARLSEVDAVVLNGGGAACPPGGGARPAYRMQLVGDELYALTDPQRRCHAADLAHLRLAALAGIGDPQRFFAHVERLGLICTPYAFPDHHAYCAGDIAAIDADALLMTEKDAVKCAGLTDRPVWVLPVSADVEPDLVTLVMEKLYGHSPA